MRRSQVILGDGPWLDAVPGFGPRMPCPRNRVAAPAIIMPPPLRGAGSRAPAGFVGNPLNKRAKGAQRQKRIKPAHEASKAVIRAQKAATKAAAPTGTRVPSRSYR